MADLQNHLRHHVRMVHPWRGVDPQFHILPIMPGPLQALVGGDLYGRGQVIDHIGLFLSFLPSASHLAPEAPGSHSIDD